MTRLFSTIAWLMLAGSQAYGESAPPIENPYALYFGIVDRVIDGDTLVVSVKLWPGFVAKNSVRVRGLATPELHRVVCDRERELGEEAKAQVERFYPPGTLVRLEDLEMDGFGRVVADVRRWRSDRWLLLKDEIIERGLGVAWDTSMGDVPWCLFGTVVPE